MSEDRLAKKWVAGTRKVLNVLRHKEPYGHFLSDGWREVLLPTGEQIGPIEVGGTVDVFVYHDSEDRWVASMKQTLISYGEVAALEVVDEKKEFGVFLDLGLKRQMLLPKSELSQLKELCPRIGDKVYVKMDHDVRGRMIAMPVIEPDLAPLCVPAPTTWKNTWVEATVYNTMNIGTFVVCDAGVLGFGVIGMIHADERMRPLRLGERLRLRVVHVREDGRVNLSMREAVHVQQGSDADKVYTFLMTRGGKMPYGDSSTPEQIKKVFQLSKGAFKRAIGLLLKQGKIRQEGEWTYAKDAVRATGPDNGLEEGGRND